MQTIDWQVKQVPFTMAATLPVACVRHEKRPLVNREAAARKAVSREHRKESMWANWLSEPFSAAQRSAAVRGATDSADCETHFPLTTLSQDAILYIPFHSSLSGVEGYIHLAPIDPPNGWQLGRDTGSNRWMDAAEPSVVTGKGSACELARRVRPSYRAQASEGLTSSHYCVAIFRHNDLGLYLPQLSSASSYLRCRQPCAQSRRRRYCRNAHREDIPAPEIIRLANIVNQS